MFRRILRTIPDAFQPNIDSKTLKEKIKNSKSPIIEHNFGLVLLTSALLNDEKHESPYFKRALKI